MLGSSINNNWKEMNEQIFSGKVRIINEYVKLIFTAVDLLIGLVTYIHRMAMACDMALFNSSFGAKDMP